MPKTSRATSPIDRACLLVCLLALGIAILYPLGRFAVELIDAGDAGMLARGSGWAALRNTALISLASVATAGALGIAIAALFVYRSFPGRRLLAALVYLPFALPPLVGVLGFYYLIGRDGLLPRCVERFLHVAGFAVPGPAAILLIHTYSFFVFFYAMTSAALESIDPSLLEAARTLGASRTRVAARVVLPLLRPALMGAALLTFMSSAASFSAPYFFGQDFPMLSVSIFNAREQFHHAEAVTLTAVLALVSLMGIAAFRAPRRLYGSASKGTRARTPVRPLGKVSAGAVWAGVLFLLVPHAAILWLSLVDHRAWQSELIPRHFTLDNYLQLVRDAGAFAPIRNSLWMSAVAAAAVVAAGLPAAYILGRKRPGAR